MGDLGAGGRGPHGLRLANHHLHRSGSGVSLRACRVQATPGRGGAIRYSECAAVPPQGHCTFYTMLREYDLHDPILHRIACIVGEADTVQEITLEPAAAGLDLICRGLRRISPNDRIALECGRLLYDALSAQLQSEAASPGKEQTP